MDTPPSHKAEFNNSKCNYLLKFAAAQVQKSHHTLIQTLRERSAAHRMRFSPLKALNATT